VSRVAPVRVDFDEVCAVANLLPRSAPGFLDAADHLSTRWESDKVRSYIKWRILANRCYPTRGYQHARSFDQSGIYRVTKCNIGITGPFTFHIPNGRKAGP